MGLDKVLVWHDYYTKDENGKKVLKERGLQRTVVVGWRDEERFISVAKCHPDDQYSRKIGRSIATGRLHSFLGGDNTVKRIYYFKLDSIMEPHYVEKLNLPEWLVRDE